MPAKCIFLKRQTMNPSSLSQKVNSNKSDALPKNNNFDEKDL